MRTDPAANFEKKVRRSDGCWIWTASVNRHGYGYFRYAGRTQRAHRVAWQLVYGDIPNGLCVLHLCDNPPCVNPDHLVLGTQRQNLADMISKKRHRSITKPETNVRGEQVGTSILTTESVKSMRRTYAAGLVTFRDLSRQYNVASSTARAAVRRRSWRHIND